MTFSLLRCFVKKFEMSNTMINTCTCKLLVFIIILIVPISQAAFPISSNVKFNDTEAQLIKTVINIIKICFSQDDLIVFGGSFRNFLNWRANFPPTLSIYLLSMAESKMFEKHERLKNVFVMNEYVISRFRYPAKLFVISVPSASHLENLLKRQRKSVLWNPRAYFFLIEEDLRSYCTKLNYSFKKAWELNVLYAMYICYNQRGLVQFYTFNPFAKNAPLFWEFSHTIEGWNGNTSYLMSIYKLGLNLDVVTTTTCETLIWRKTLVVEGYPINMVAGMKPKMFVYKNATSALIDAAQKKRKPRPISDFRGLDANIHNLVTSHLKLKTSVSIYDQQGFVDTNNNVHGILADIIKMYSFDIAPNERYRRTFWRLETYPHDETSMCVITQKKDIESTPTMMLEILKPSVMLLVILVSCMQTIIFKSILKINYLSASVEVLRTLLGYSTMNEPQNRPGRFIFAYTLLSLFALNSYFSSMLTASFTFEVKDENIRTLDDLIDSNYKLFGERALMEFLNNEILLTRFTEMPFEECMQKMSPKDVACLCDCFEGIYYILKDQNIYLSDPLYGTLVGYIVREDWPLLRRVDQLIQRIREVGIQKFQDRSIFYEAEKKSAAQQKEWHNAPKSEGNPIGFKELEYSFKVLVGGVLVALGVFVIEVIRSRRENRRILQRNLEQLKILQKVEISVYNLDI